MHWGWRVRLGCACLFREIWVERDLLDHITQKRGLWHVLLCSLMGEPVAGCGASSLTHRASLLLSTRCFPWGRQTHIQRKTEELCTEETIITSSKRCPCSYTPIVGFIGSAALGCWSLLPVRNEDLASKPHWLCLASSNQTAGKCPPLLLIPDFASLISQNKAAFAFQKIFKNPACFLTTSQGDT